MILDSLTDDLCEVLDDIGQSAQFVHNGKVLCNVPIVIGDETIAAAGYEALDADASTSSATVLAQAMPCKPDVGDKLIVADAVYIVTAVVRNQSDVCYSLTLTVEGRP